MEIEQSINIGWIAISDLQRVAKLPDVLIPARAIAEVNVAPTDASIIHKRIADRTRPVTDRVVNGSRSVAIGQEHLRFCGGVVLIGPRKAIGKAVLFRGLEIHLQIALIDVEGGFQGHGKGQPFLSLYAGLSEQ